MLYHDWFMFMSLIGKSLLIFEISRSAIKIYNKASFKVLQNVNNSKNSAILVKFKKFLMAFVFTRK